MLTYIKRRFAFEHPHLLDRVAADDDDDDDERDGEDRGGSAQPDSPADSEDHSRPSSVMSNLSQRHKKRKRSQLLAVPLLKGNDFWSMAEKWFSARMQTDQFGTSWNTPKWSAYVQIIFPLILPLT